MEFFKCSIGGESYGTGITEIERGVAQQKGTTIKEVQFQFNVSTDLIFLGAENLMFVIILFTGREISKFEKRTGF